MTPHRAAVLMLLSLPLLAQAQATVWRCGADGRSYADAPCAGGRVVEVADARSAAMVADARALASHERALAQQWSTERRVADAQAARQGPATLTSPAAPALKTRAPAPGPQSLRAQKKRSVAGAGTSRAAGRASPRAAD
ncbi:MAG: hypothetical protein U1F56_04005 [Rubrivivax sp.]